MKKILYIAFIILFINIITGCYSIDKKETLEKDLKKENGSMMIVVNNNEYEVELENNETVLKLSSLLPLELTMNELNSNEKYVYLDFELPEMSSNIKHITAGDVMLYGNNCLVIFYKSFDTSYSYTKIGHINNLPDLGKDSINVVIRK